MNKKLPVMLLICLLAGCTVTGPADDGFENSNEWVDNGRLLSDRHKVIYSSQQPGQHTATSSAGASSMNSEIDFAAYQQWLEARDKNTAEYHKFKQWQEFEAFLRWKKLQSQ